MKIAISCSVKYRDLIKEVINSFDTIGITAFFPNLDNDMKEDDLNLANMKSMALDHYKAIDEADMVYFITPNGYMGTSCKIELGYIVAKNKPVYFSEPTKDIGIDFYAKGFIPVDKLELFKNL